MWRQFTDWAATRQPVLAGPDAARYILMARGEKVATPFYLRWFMPWACGDDPGRWWAARYASWVLAFGGMVWWGIAAGHGWKVGLAAGVFLVSLPGLLGPRPIEVALPSMAVGVLAVASFEQGWWWLAIPLVLLAGAIRETAPGWAALWAWHPLLLIGFVAPLVRAIVSKPGMDEVTANGKPRQVHDEPLRLGLQTMTERGWRNGWELVAPWGVTLAALVDPSLSIVVLLVLAYGQLLVTTDNTRLVHTAAGPAMALGAAVIIPESWLLFAAVLGFVFWRTPIDGTKTG